MGFILNYDENQKYSGMNQSIFKLNLAQLNSSASLSHIGQCGSGIKHYKLQILSIVLSVLKSLLLLLYISDI